MTDRSSEDRSRSNEETPKLVQTVASIRGELMTRFSDRLSMEEIASCAYAVAMRDGRGGTRMVEEERSRFEKLDAAFVRLEIACQDVRDALDEFRETRAALEDRQEAAHNAVGEIQCRYCLRMVSVYRVDTDERKLCEFCWKSAHPEESFRPGVPSEATPSKENAPIRTLAERGLTLEPELAVRAIYEPAPAPEVQGTPTKSNVAHQPWCASAPRPMDVPMGRGPYPCDCGTVKAAPAPEVQGAPTKEVMPQCHKCGGESPWGDMCASCLVGQGKCDLHVGWHKQIENCVRWEPAAPVGTPQKETPPMTDFAKVRVAQYEARIPCGNCGHVHLGRCSVCDPPGCEQIVPPTAPVPEGVQGKEPHTFEQFWKVEKEALLARVVCRCSAGSTCDSSAVHVDKFAKEIFVSGEAAGRRSAITEAQESMKKRAADAVRSWNCAPDGCKGCGDERLGTCGENAAEKIEELPILECSELQEKTKP